MCVAREVRKPNAWITAAVAAALFACGAGESAQATTLPPKTPAIVPFSGGALPAHVDYVRLTYVLADGSESAPSAEVPNGVSVATLTRVDSPETRTGVVGYNVYAVANNGDADIGHILQNDAPVPLGTDFDEPSTGWRTTGKKLKASAPDRTIESIALDGASVAMPRTPTVGGNIVFSHASGDVPPVVTIATNGALLGRAGSAEFSFDRSTHFTQLPAFLLFPSAAIGKDDTAVVVLRDETTGTTIATYDKFELGVVSFLGQTWNGNPVATAFDVRAGDVYEASFIAHPSSIATALPFESPDFVLPKVNQLTVTMHVPPPLQGASTLYVRASLTPPLGVEPPSDASISAVSLYAIVALPSHATYDGTIHATVSVPPGTPAGTEYSIAAYDPQWWNHGWYLHVLRGRTTSTQTVSFDFDMDSRRIYAQTYVFAFCTDRTSRALRPRPVHIDPRPVLAVIGDSTMLMQPIQPSALRCGVTIQASDNCQYLHDASADYASIAGTGAGYRVINLSHLGAATIKDAGEAEAASQAQVPQIPADASIVLVAAGLNDTLSDEDDVSPHLDDLTARIRRTAPRARIVYVGIRYYNDTFSDPKSKRRIDLWDERESTLGRLFGDFLDLRTIVPAGYTATTPDGAHYTQSTAKHIAQALMQILLRQHRSART